MTEVLWPVDIIPGTQSWRIVDNAGSFQSPLSGTVRTVSRAGSRLGCKITIPPVKGEERARIKAALGRVLGVSNTIWVPDFSTDRRGSFPATELLTNNDFSNGTTGWTASQAALSVSDQVARLTFNGASGFSPYFYQNVALTQYAPHVLRAMIVDGQQTSGLSIGPYISLGSADASNYSTSRGLRIVSGVPDTASADNQFPLAFSSASGYTAGAYAEVAWASLSRCALVDNGPNALLYSDQFDNAAWTKTRGSTTANATAAPDGTTTADGFTEDASAATTHFISQSLTVSSAAADYEFSVSLKAASRTWALMYLVENTGGHNAYTYINLSTGALGTSGSGGANFTNQRAFVVSQGNGWFRVTIVGRKTNAATSISAVVMTADGDLDVTIDSPGSGFYLWRASVAKSSVPTRGAQATTTATTGTAQTGSGIYLKGLPASTSGLRKAGDFIQVGSQGNWVIADLDSDAAGLGYLQCALPCRVSPADNDPVFLNTPMAKMRLASEINWDTGPGQFSSFDLEFVEDVS